jgi:hypothetical protein
MLIEECYQKGIELLKRCGRKDGGRDGEEMAKAVARLEAGLC